jgi:hypothetical protein
MTLLSAPVVLAEEGMWLFSAPPAATLKSSYGVELSPEWLAHVQHSTVRFSNGGSGAFVSATGLVATNHHVALQALQRLSTPANNRVQKGFLARSLEEEVRCPDIELQVLLSDEDVTARIEAAVKPGASTEEALAARRIVRRAIEREASGTPEVRAEVAAFFQGAMYRLMRYRRYNDLRLVFAPEQKIAFFGGDADNFEYPRYALDFCLLRAYENGKPAKIRDFLTWNLKGASSKQLVFVAGQPGHTNRFLTCSDLRAERDERAALLMEWAEKMEGALLAFASRGEEQRMRVQSLLFSMQNSRKRYQVERDSIASDEVFTRRSAEEMELQRVASMNAAWKESLSAWKEIEETQKDITKVYQEYMVLGRLAERSSSLFFLSRGLYRHAFESGKPDGARLSAYREANRAALETMMLSDMSSWREVEETLLGGYLRFAVDQLGGDNPMAAILLQGKSPDDRAKELIAGTNVMEGAFRRKLWLLNSKQMEAAACSDSMLAFVASIDDEARRAMLRVEQLQERKNEAYAKIGLARRALCPGELYPDANSTLRLGFGTVVGYEERGAAVPPFTTLGEMYGLAGRGGDNPNYVFPEVWLSRKPFVDLSVPLNFASSCDVIGGSSGSPVIDRAGKMVGIVFDGNRDCAGGEFAYSSSKARAIAVDVRGIVEVLRKIYRADGLAAELIADSL